MGKDSGIQWTHHTFNPWRGCTKVSAGCVNCYAEALSKRNPGVLGIWGDKGTRVVAAEAYWRQPLKWDREAKAAGERRRVFCASLADVFEDREELEAPRVRLFDLILSTPNLDWLLLTKRPEVMANWLGGGFMGVADRLPHAESWPWPNVWLGTSVEDQEQAKKRIPVLLSIPAIVHWLSCEPLLSPIDLSDYIYLSHGRPSKTWPHGPVDWVIVGGEGNGSRPFHLAWARSLIEQCRGVHTACFVKQLGTNPQDFYYGRMPVVRDGPKERMFVDYHGGDMTEWPEDLRVREWPEARKAVAL